MSEWAEFARHRDRIRQGERIRGKVGLTTEQEWDWYDSVGLALRIIGRDWRDDLTDEEDAFVLAFADEIGPRPECELPCGPCSSAAGEEIYHGALGCPRPERER